VSAAERGERARSGVSTFRTYAASAGGVNGYWKNSVPASSTPWCRIAFSVKPDM
jgi:hypothetical protein